MSTPVTSNDAYQFGIDPGFEFGPGVTGRTAHAYKDAGRVWLIGAVYITADLGADVLMGEEAVLKLPDGYLPGPDAPSEGDWGTPHAILRRPLEGGPWVPEFAWVQAGDEPGIFLGGEAEPNHDWTIAIGGFSYLHR